jgi:hypothetical protein
VIMHDNSEEVCEIQVKPHERLRIPLGEFASNDHFKGLSIEISPDPEPDNAVVARILQVDSDTPGSYALLMHIANHGDKAVNAVVNKI